VIKVSPETVKIRMQEFKSTKNASLTLDQFKAIDN